MFEPAYWAGFVDGEGSIGISVRERKGRRYHVLHVTVANVHPAVLLAARAEWGGNMTLKQRTNPKHNAVWHWRVWSRKAIAFLTAIEPYMIVKRDEARLALEYAALGDFRTKGRTKGIPAEIVELRDHYRDAIMARHSRQGGGNGAAIRPEFAAIQQEALSV